MGRNKTPSGTPAFQTHTSFVQVAVGRVVQRAPASDSATRASTVALSLLIQKFEEHKVADWQGHLPGQWSRSFAAVEAQLPLERRPLHNQRFVGMESKCPLVPHCG